MLWIPLLNNANRHLAIRESTVNGFKIELTFKHPLLPCCLKNALGFISFCLKSAHLAALLPISQGTKIHDITG
jgi:hypothetical protein